MLNCVTAESYMSSTVIGCERTDLPDSNMIRNRCVLIMHVLEHFEAVWHQFSRDT